jgi:hypothetical protein
MEKNKVKVTLKDGKEEELNVEDISSITFKVQNKVQKPISIELDENFQRYIDGLIKNLEENDGNVDKKAFEELKTLGILAIPSLEKFMKISNNENVKNKIKLILSGEPYPEEKLIPAQQEW